MARMAGPDCAVRRNLMNTHHTTPRPSREQQGDKRVERKVVKAQITSEERVLCPLCCVRSEVFVTSIIDFPLEGSMRVT